MRGSLPTFACFHHACLANFQQFFSPVDFWVRIPNTTLPFSVHLRQIGNALPPLYLHLLLTGTGIR